MPQPGKSTDDGQHWVYRYDGHRKCWFQVAEGTAAAKKTIHHAARHRSTTATENESAPRNRKAVVDAREELLTSAPTVAPQPAPTVPEIKMVNAVPVTGAAAFVPPAPVVAEPATDPRAPDHPTPRQVDVETLLAAAPTASDSGAVSAPPVTPAAGVQVSDDGGGWRTTWLGVLLMALGLVSLLGLLGAGRFLGEGNADQASSPPEDEVRNDPVRWTPEPSFVFSPTAVFTPTAFTPPTPDEGLFRPQNARPAI